MCRWCDEDEDTGVSVGTIATLVVIVVVVIGVSVLLYFKRGSLRLLNFWKPRGVVMTPPVATTVGYNQYGVQAYPAAGYPHPASNYPPQVNIQISQAPTYPQQPTMMVLQR